MARQPVATAKPMRAKTGTEPSGSQVPAGKNGKNATLVVAVITMMALALFERPICLLLVFALVPTMLAWMIDNTPKQSLIRTVAPLNLASALPFAIKLWHEHNSLDQVFSFLSGTYTWLAMYGAAVFGWMLYYLAPAVISAVVARRIERMREDAVERQAALLDEWGEEVQR